MNTDAALQLLLPTDKRNPSFSLYHHETDRTLHVYYGFELMEIVPADRQHSQHKLLVANLYNAGLKVTRLEAVFGFDRKTMRKWGQALKSGDADRLHQALQGRQARRKLTPVIASFIRFRFGEVYERHSTRYNVQLRQEVEQVFKVKLSGETLRPLLQSLRGASQPVPPGLEPASPPDPVSAPERVPVPESGERIERSVTLSLPEGPKAADGTADGAEPAAPLGETGCEWASKSGIPEPPARKLSPPFLPWTPGQIRWSDHLGMLLFWKALMQIVAILDPPQPLLQQWLASVLLGCHNVEQTKYLNERDLGVLLGEVTRFPTPQRDALERLANPPTLQALLRWNLGQVEAGKGGDFYLDPHTKHYTGMKPILKGWCAAIRWADKALHSDFLHTVQGEPIYFECADNFADLRERLWKMVDRARQVLGWPKDKVLTLVVDRAVFGQEAFGKFLADPFLHVITWEKGYERGQWSQADKKGEFTLERKRNRADDVRVYRFQYMDRPWAKNPKLRQLIVLATNPEDRQIEVSVLTDDPQRLAVEVIALMFNRWLQENDFKYLDKHFGINQITSYRTIEYQKLAGQIEDRQIQSGQAKALQQQGQKIKHQQSRWLLEQEQADFQQQKRLPQMAALEQRLADEATASDLRPALLKTLERMRQASQRYEVKRTERRQKINELSGQMEENERQKQTVQKEESRLAQLIAQGMHRLDTTKKQLMDAIKVSARNLFYKTLQPFKKAYDNFRDDHDYFRKLTQAGGVLRWTGSEFQAHLLPQVNYPPALRRIITQWLEEVNATQPVMPDGSQRPVKFFLSDREDFEIRLKDPTPSQPKPDSPPKI